MELWLDLCSRLEKQRAKTNKYCLGILQTGPTVGLLAVDLPFELANDLVQTIVLFLVELQALVFVGDLKLAPFDFIREGFRF